MSFIVETVKACNVLSAHQLRPQEVDSGVGALCFVPPPSVFKRQLHKKNIISSSKRVLEAFAVADSVDFHQVEFLLRLDKASVNVFFVLEYRVFGLLDVVDDEPVI